MRDRARSCRRTKRALYTRVALHHSISQDAVRTILRALRSGGGSMAQFSHPEFGGMSQWSPGMTMVGDMFNNGLKSKLDAGVFGNLGAVRCPRPH